MIKLTVGVCVRNCEVTVGQAIESIVEQDFPHGLMEIIFVNDGSIDNTLGVIEDWVSKIDIRSRIFSDSWRGLGAARNTVVNNAQGDYVVWVDGDMILERSYFAKQVRFMEDNPKVGIAKGAYELSPGPNLISTLEIYSRCADKMTDFNRKMAGALGTGGCIYRLEAIRRAGGFDDSLKGYGEDWDAESRVRAIGFSLQVTQAKWRDYERLGLSLKELWNRYVTRGSDLYYFSKKHEGLLRLYRMLPPAGFFAGLKFALRLRKSMNDKVIFLLPFETAFKSAAWSWGYLRAKLGEQCIKALT
jgi:glycosyltransferase involved in cell wall biosynthesis